MASTSSIIDNTKSCEKNLLKYYVKKIYKEKSKRLEV